jgi:hypothetical protein
MHPFQRSSYTKRISSSVISCSYSLYVAGIACNAAYTWNAPMEQPAMSARKNGAKNVRKMIMDMPMPAIPAICIRFIMYNPNL